MKKKQNLTLLLLLGAGIGFYFISQRNKGKNTEPVTPVDELQEIAETTKAIELTEKLEQPLEMAPQTQGARPQSEYILPEPVLEQAVEQSSKFNIVA